MSNYIEPIQELIGAFASLPGVGNKTAQRYALAVINMEAGQVKQFAEAMLDAKRNVKFCKICGNFTDKDICEICEKRDNNIICVVKDAKDVIAMEKIRDYKGVYHILNGVLNPMENIGANDIRIKELVQRVNDKTKEVIVATNPDVEGEVTASYIAKLLRPLGVKVTRLAQGVATGSDLQYTDERTLSKAFENRKEI